MTSSVHPTAIVEDGVEIGAGTRLWDAVHVRGPSRIGRDCIIGEKTYIAPGVAIGDRVKINAFVYVCSGVTIEDGVLVAAGVVFTNDLFPRATSPDLTELRPSAYGAENLPILVHAGASIGANATVLAGVEVGRFALVGMGSVVTRSVGNFQLVHGNPARLAGAVCRCGRPLARFRRAQAAAHHDLTCAGCGRRYVLGRGEIAEASGG